MRERIGGESWASSLLKFYKKSVGAIWSDPLLMGGHGVCWNDDLSVYVRCDHLSVYVRSAHVGRHVGVPHIARATLAGFRNVQRFSHYAAHMVMLKMEQSNVANVCCRGTYVAVCWGARRFLTIRVRGTFPTLRVCHTYHNQRGDTMWKHTFSTKANEGGVSHETTVMLPEWGEATEEQRQAIYNMLTVVSSPTVKVQSALRTAIKKGVRGKALNEAAQKGFNDLLAGRGVSINTERAIVMPEEEKKELEYTEKQLAHLRSIGVVC
jgi:hypothetical protein